MTDATITTAVPDHRAAFRAATFGDVLRSEWTKLRSVRSTFWALTVTVVLGIGLGPPSARPPPTGTPSSASPAS
jgi:ABC-2 type transport system permease protein